MKNINVKIYYNSPLLMAFHRSISGFTLGSKIYLRKSKEKTSPVLLNHEKIHVCQYQDLGVLRFLRKYFISEIALSYRKKSYEIEAYENQNDFNYISKRWPDYNLIIEE